MPWDATSVAPSAMRSFIASQPADSNTQMNEFVSALLLSTDKRKHRKCFVHLNRNSFRPHAAANVKIPDLQKLLRKLFESDGALRWLKFPELGTTEAPEPQARLRSAKSELKRGRINSFLTKLSEIRLGWFGKRGLREAPTVTAPSSSTRQSSAGDLLTDGASAPALRQQKNNAWSFGKDGFGAPYKWKDSLIHLAEAVCPWDYDRKEPSLTFVNVWTDVESVTNENESARVKLVSTIKPLHQEWKATARTKLLSLGPGGVVFGKAGIYLVGDKDPYVGLEADRVVQVPHLKNTKVFFNANYRSSRKPEQDTVVASTGVQQTVSFGDGLDITFRVGFNSESGFSRPMFAPIPYGFYF